MSKYTRKKKAPEDEFVDFWTRSFTAIAPYLRAIGITLGTAAIIVVAGWGITGWMDSRAEAASTALTRATRTYDSDLVTTDEPVKTDEENPVPRFKTAKERTDATLAQLKVVEGEYKRSDMSTYAALIAAGVLFDQGKWDEAAAAYEKLLPQLKAPTVKALAREALGMALEQKGSLDLALGAYKDLESTGKAGDFYRDRALFHQARVQAKKGDTKKAKDLYTEILTKMPTSTLREEVQNRLAALP